MVADADDDIVMDLAELMPTAASTLMKKVGIVAVCVTRTTLYPVPEAAHGAATMLESDTQLKDTATVGLGRLVLKFAPPDVVA
jgi:hypothetical protein